jgi:hypothetical protein
LIREIRCDPDWPTCFLDCSQTAVVHEYFVFKESEFEVQDNYFYKELCPKQIEEEQKPEFEKKPVKSPRFSSQ